MTGLETLQADGLDIAALDSSSVAELLEWHRPTSKMPDSEINVIAWVDRGDERDWTAAFHDGEDWRECESGGLVDGTVLMWAQPEGPAQC